MNISGGRSLYGAALASVLAVGAMLQAQNPSIAVGGEHPVGAGFEGGGRFGSGFHGAPITGAPYSAVRTTTHVQALANGSTVTHTSQVQEARDSSGRTYVASLPGATQGSGETHLFVRVFDPVNRESISWSLNSKQATVMHLPEASQMHGARGPQGGEAAGAGRFHRNGEAPTVEQLGSKTINGVVSEGTRTTRVIPAGAQGNSEALTITHETWVSQDLKIEVERVDTDPRFGTTTMEVTNLSRAEPNAALFQAPAGYTVKETTMGQGRRGFTAAP